MKTRRLKIKTRQRKLQKKRSMRKWNKSKSKGGAGFFQQLGLVKQPEQKSEPKPLLSLAEQARKADAALAATLVTAGTVGAIANAGYATAALMSSTGVLLPLGGALLGAMLIANKLSIMYTNNKKLYPIMLDSLNILASVYRLNDLIMKIFGVFIIFIFNNDAWNTHSSNIQFFNNKDEYKQLFDATLEIRAKKLSNKLSVTIKVPVKNDTQGKMEEMTIPGGDILLQIGINKQTQEHIIYKTNLLISNLLQTTTDELLKSLEFDKDIENAHFKKIIKDEQNRRRPLAKSSNGFADKYLKNTKARLNTVANSASSKFGEMNRTMNRAFYASYIKQDIIDNLALIQSYTLDLKVQYDFTLQLYQRRFSFEWCQPIWNLIEQLDEFKDYAIPRDIKQVIDNAIANHEITDDVVAAASAAVGTAPDAKDAADEENATTTGEVPAPTAQNPPFVNQQVQNPPTGQGTSTIN